MILMNKKDKLEYIIGIASYGGIACFISAAYLAFGWVGAIAVLGASLIALAFGAEMVYQEEGFDDE